MLFISLSPFKRSNINHRLSQCDFDIWNILFVPKHLVFLHDSVTHADCLCLLLDQDSSADIAVVKALSENLFVIKVSFGVATVKMSSSDCVVVVKISSDGVVVKSLSESVVFDKILYIHVELLKV